MQFSVRAYDGPNMLEKRIAHKRSAREWRKKTIKSD